MGADGAGTKQQFQSFEAFFESGIWKQIIQQMQQDQSELDLNEHERKC